jgi:hypothetical protein
MLKLTCENAGAEYAKSAMRRSKECKVRDSKKLSTFKHFRKAMKSGSFDFVQKKHPHTSGC